MLQHIKNSGEGFHPSSLAYTIGFSRDFKYSRLPDMSCPISKLTEEASVLALEIAIVHVTVEGIAHMISNARRNSQTLIRLVDSLFCITCSLENNAFSVLHYVIKVTLHYYNYVTSIRDSFCLGTFAHFFIRFDSALFYVIFADLVVPVLLEHDRQNMASFCE